MDGLETDEGVINNDMLDVKGELAGVKVGRTSMASFLESINGKMKEMLDKGGTSSVGSQPSASKKENVLEPMIKYDRFMLRRVPGREVSLHAYVMSRCTISSNLAEIADLCKNEVLQPAGLESFLDDLFFFLKRTDKKNAYDTGNGTEAAALRTRVLLNDLKKSRAETFRRLHVPINVYKDSNVNQ